MSGGRLENKNSSVEERCRQKCRSVLCHATATLPRRIALLAMCRTPPEVEVWA